MLVPVALYKCYNTCMLIPSSLDVNIDNGTQLQATLAEMTGQKTVPNVFISGQHVGKPSLPVSIENFG
jgi:glutaredoxin